MRLRNLFMILLLCMTVGIFGVSCTGDDGAQGPPGPPGPPGEAGPAGDAGDGADEDTDFYTFLESWGVEGGEIGCSDDALTGSGPFPGGDDVLGKLSADAPVVNNNPLAVECGDAFFNEISAADVNDLGDLNLADGTGGNNRCIYSRY